MGPPTGRGRQPHATFPLSRAQPHPVHTCDTTHKHLLDRRPPLQLKRLLLPELRGSQTVLGGMHRGALAAGRRAPGTASQAPRPPRRCAVGSRARARPTAPPPPRAASGDEAGGAGGRRPGSAMPRLPPRPAKRPARHGRRLGSGGPGGGPPQPPPESPQALVQERALAGLLAYTGMMGTAAVAAALLSPGVELLGNAHWDGADVALGLQLMAPVYLLNFLVLFPNYSSWKLPEAPLDALAEAEAAGAADARRGQQEPAAAVGEPGGAAGGGAPPAAPPPPSPPAASPGGWQPRSALGRLKDAMFLAQGHYLSLNPALVLPPAVQAAALGAECLAAELLYRSVALQLLGGWLSDRLTEAGAEDALLGVAGAGGLPALPTHTAGQLAAVGVLAAASAGMVARRAWRMSRRPQLTLGLQGRGPGRAAEVRGAQQQQQQQQQEVEGQGVAVPRAAADAQQGGQEAPGPSGSDAASPSGGSQRSASRAAAGLAAAAAAGRRPGEGQPDSAWRRPPPRTLNALALSQLIQGSRDIGQMTALGLSFALTGNLAAPLAAALINQALLSALQKRGVDRARERSIAMARHLAGLTRQLRDIQRKQQDKRQQQQEHEQQQEGAGREQLPQHLAAEGSAAEVPPAAAISNVGSSKSGSSSGSVGVGPAAAIAAEQEAGPPACLLPHATAATAAGAEQVQEGGSGGGEAAVPVALGGGGGGRVAETISALDLLLGEQLGEHAAAGGASK